MIPSVDEIGVKEEREKWVAELLKAFMKLLIPSRLKQHSLGQCIVQAARRKCVIAPIPFYDKLSLSLIFCYTA